MFEQWKELLEELRREEEEEQRRQEVVWRVLKRMLNKTLALAFSEWCGVVDEVKWAREKVSQKEAFERQAKLAWEDKMGKKAKNLETSAIEAQERARELEEELERERVRAAAELERERAKAALAAKEAVVTAASKGGKEESKACVVS